jgi:uracil-DNA glycosylase
MDSKWSYFLTNEGESPYGAALKDHVRKERGNHTVYPNTRNTFAAFELTKFDSIKCVIIGQDPYHGPGQATGLAFSVSDGVRIPPSLDNIFKEYESDLGYPRPQSGDLSKWAEQGVMLLNTVLTVRESAPMSHANIGWQTLTKSAIKKISDERSGVVFILWGRYAQEAASDAIDGTKHHKLVSPHPSPLSAYKGFFGSKPFSKTNELLARSNISPIDWKLN